MNKNKKLQSYKCRICSFRQTGFHIFTFVVLKLYSHFITGALAVRVPLRRRMTEPIINALFQSVKGPAVHYHASLAPNPRRNQDLLELREFKTTKVRPII